VKDDNYVNKEHEEKTREGGDKREICRAFECVQGRGVENN
jgi:hypothetical protein